MRRAALALLAALAASVLATPSRADPAVAWGDCTAEPPVAGVLCGTLTVPETRDAAMPRVLALPVYRLPAAFLGDAPPLVVVGLRPGLVPMPLDADAYALLALLAKDRDVVVLEPRGLGGTRLDCDLGGDPQALLGPLFPPEAVAACHAALAARADLAAYTDAAIAQDLADLIQALGAPQADVLAFTAGGRAAFVLAAQNPATVRRLVLVSPILPDAPLPVALAQGAGNALSGMTRLCFRSDNCHSMSLGRRLDRSIGRLDKKPAAVDLGEGETEVTLDGDGLAIGFHLASIARAGFVRGPDLVRLAFDGDLEPASQAVADARATFAEGALGLHLALACSAERDRLADIDKAAFKGLYVGNRWLEAYRTACEAWPVAAAPIVAAPPPLPPMLVVLPAYGALAAPEPTLEALKAWSGEEEDAVQTRSLLLAAQPEDWPSDSAARTCAGSVIAAYLAADDPNAPLDDACAKDLPPPVLELGEPEAP